MNIKKILFIAVLTALLLQGCIATTVVAGATVAGLIVYDSRSSRTIMDDCNISYKAQNIINSDPMLRGYSSISVTSFNHVVLLTGETNSQSLKERAAALIANVDGIKRIHNQVVIGPKISLATLSSDTLITTQVKTALLNDKGLRTAQLKVITQNSNVYLMGLISKEDGDLAAKITQNVDGVNKVIKVFEYTR